VSCTTDLGDDDALGKISIIATRLD
jgi:hypothetical protein